MKLHYNVLCIDDKIPRLKEIKDPFDDLNHSIGIDVSYVDISTKIKPKEDPTDFRRRITEEISKHFTPESPFFDLILVDLHFGPKVDEVEVFNGSNVIEIIRRTHTLYRPIVFYSSGEPETHSDAVEQLEKVAKSSEIYGMSVFTKPFDELALFVQRIAKEMHFEEHKINSVRGLLMDQVSELDANIITAIEDSTLWNSVPEANRPAVIREFKRGVQHQHTKIDKLSLETKDLEYDAVRNYVIEHNGRLDMFCKGKILREILRYIEPLKKNGEILSDAINPGEKSISIIRNSYAHRTAEALNATHDVPKCKLIREETKRQIANIQMVVDRI